MPTASAIRLQIESALAQKIPSALTPASKMIRPVAATGIASLDDILSGGLSRSRETEIATKTILLECAGRFHHASKSEVRIRPSSAGSTSAALKLCLGRRRTHTRTVRPALPSTDKTALDQA